MSECTNEPKEVINYILPHRIRKELGDYGKFINRIKVVMFPDNRNTRSVYVCTTANDEIEEVSPTPMQACGLVTLLNGKFVMIHSEGETTLHFTNAETEEDVINKVYMLSEKKGLTKGIATYKKMVSKTDLISF